MADYIVKKASADTDDQLAALGLTGIPPEWPIESYPYVGQDIPDGFTQMSDEDITTLKGNNQAAYDAWLASKSPIAPPPAPTEVVTQFEKRDKTLKLAHGFASVGEDSTATILMQIPGTPGTTDGRWISSGVAFFDTITAGDLIQSVRFTDEDNILGQGAGYVVGSYTDDDAPSDNQGWAIPPNGWIKCEAIGGYGFAPAGFYIKIVGKKANGATSGTFYVNLEWGKVE